MINIIVYCREGCPHSENTYSILKNYMDIDSKVKIKLNKVKNTPEDKENIFLRYYDILQEHRTFPIIILNFKTSNYLIGGNQQLTNIISYIKNNYNIDNHLVKNPINIFIKIMKFLHDKSLIS